MGAGAFGKFKQFGKAIGAGIKAAVPEIGEALGEAAKTAALEAAKLSIITPTKLALEAVFAEMKNIFDAFNPGLQITKAFNQYSVLQEKFIAANMNFSKIQLEVAKIMEQGGLKGGSVETMQQLQANLQSGIRANTGQLLGLQERMRLTGQKTDFLTKAMSQLSFETGDSSDSIDSLVRNTDRLSQIYKVSQEALTEAMTALSRDTLDLASIYGESEELRKFNSALTALSRGGLLDSQQQNAIVKLFYSTNEQALQLRGMLGVSQDFVNRIASMKEEDQAKALTEEFRRISQKLELFSKSNQGNYEIIQNYLGPLFKAIDAPIRNLAKQDLNKVTEMLQPLVAKEAEDPYETLKAAIEATGDPYQRMVMHNLNAYREQLIDISKTLNWLPAKFANQLLGTPLPADEQAKEAFQKVANAIPNLENAIEFSEAMAQQAAQEFAKKDASWWDTSEGKIKDFLLEIGKRNQLLQFPSSETKGGSESGSAGGVLATRYFGEQTTPMTMAQAIASNIPIKDIIDELEKSKQGTVGELPTQITTEVKAVIQSLLEDIRHRSSLAKTQEEQNKIIREGLIKFSTADAGALIRSFKETDKASVQFSLKATNISSLEQQMQRVRTQGTYYQYGSGEEKDKTLEVMSELLQYLRKEQERKAANQPPMTAPGMGAGT